MNDKLLKTRLESINHYKSEIDKLNEAIKITTETRESIIASLTEFCILEHDDIFQRENGNIYKFGKVLKTRELSAGDLIFECIVFLPYIEYGDQHWKEVAMSLYLKEQDKIKVLK